MWSWRSAGAVGFFLGCAACVSAIGCATEQTSKQEESVSSTESELRLSGTRYLGKIVSGQTRTGTYYNPPRYRSYAFDAKGGDEITVDVASEDGDAVTFITTDRYDVVAYNDDASSETFDSKVLYKVPANAPARSYRIVFRDYELMDATFSVTLNITSAVTSTCAYDGNTYTPGESFPSTDNCNTCFCGTNGNVGCTKKACTCDPSNEPWRNYLGTPQQCMVMRYTCAAGQVPFSNSCGCGCETP